MSFKRWICSMICLTALVSALRADQVNLNNGDRVSGKLIKKDGDNLTVKTDLMGVVTIPWKSVVSVNSQDPVTVVLTSGQSLVGPVRVDAKEEKVEVVTATSRESARLSELVAIRDEETQKRFERMEKPGLLDLWAGSVDLGLSSARGNARTNTFTIAAGASRETRTNKTAAYFNQIFSSALVDGVSAATAKAIRGGWSYNRNLKPRLLWNLFNDYEYDRFQDLDLRVVLGSGLGYTMIKQERKRLDLLGGAAYNHEEFSTPLIRNSAEAYWGDDFNYKPSRVTEFEQRFRIFHNLSDLGSYRVNFDLSAVMNLNRWLAWHLTISDRLLSDPVPGRQRNDVLYTTGLRLRFAR
jgi:putative salt-induced outer membrane protein YdiY